MKLFTWYLAPALALLLSTASLHADVAYSDSTFNNASWSTPIFYQGYNGGSMSTSQVATGGHLGAYQKVDATLNAASNSSTPSTAVAFHHRTTFADFVASPGNMIGTVDFSLDVLNDAPTGLEIGVALEQNGKLYVSDPISTNGHLSWTTYTRNSLHVTDFSEFVSSPPNLNIEITSHPDFSATGAPIAVGYYTYGFTVGAGVTFHDGYDNWSVIVHTIPEPSTLVLAGFGGLALLVGRWKCRRAR